MAINMKEYTKTKYEYIYKNNNNGTYLVDLPLKNKLYNKTERKRKTNLRTIEEAKDFISKEKVKMKEQGNLNTKPILFKEAFNSYIKECEFKVRTGNLAESTVDGKKTIFKNQILPKLGNVKLAEISEKHIEKFQDDLLSMNCLRDKDKNLSNQTIRKIHKQLSAFLNYCVRKRLITYNPAGVVGNFKKIKEEREYITYEEFEKLLSVVDNKRDLFIIQLLFYTGLRISELLGLSTESIITTEKGTFLKVTETYYKNKIRKKAKTDLSIREISLDNITVNMYKTYLEYRNNYNQINKINSKYLFANNKGNCEVIGDRAIRDMLKKYLKRAGIDKNITPHLFRHGHVALLISLGEPLQHIKDRLGHSDIRTTSNEYGHMYLDDKLVPSNKLTTFQLENGKTMTPIVTPNDNLNEKKD